MSKKWVVVLSDGTTWEVVSPAMRVYVVEEGEVAELDPRELARNGEREGIALADLLAARMEVGRMEVGLVHMPEGRTRDLGTFEGVALTYETLRVAPYEPESCEAVVFRDGFWRTPDGETWTDVNLSVAGGAS